VKNARKRGRVENKKRSEVRGKKQGDYEGFLERFIMFKYSRINTDERRIGGIIQQHANFGSAPGLRTKKKDNYPD